MTSAVEVDGRAIDHPDMTPELAEVLLTDTARLTYEVATAIAIEDGDSA